MKAEMRIDGLLIFGKDLKPGISTQVSLLITTPLLYLHSKRTPQHLGLNTPTSEGPPEFTKALSWASHGLEMSQTAPKLSDDTIILQLKRNT